MKLLKKTKVTITKSDNKIQWAIFKCPDLYCGQEVERILSCGLKQESCGCRGGSQYKHGESYTRLYNIWKDMKRRCLNPNFKQYKDYGGRGITICNEWLEFIPFRDWSLNNGYADNLTIDRINNDGNYEPNNCQWIPGKENSQKTRRVILTLKKANEIRELDNTGNYTQQELAKIYGVCQKTISNIINNKIWKVEK